jgi:hypothetical protein
MSEEEACSEWWPFSVGDVTGSAPAAAPSGWRAEIDLESVERDYGAAGAIAENLARRCDGKAIDATTHVQLWPTLEQVEAAELAWWFDATSDPAETFVRVAEASAPAFLPCCFSDTEPSCATLPEIWPRFARCARSGEAA